MPSLEIQTENLPKKAGIYILRDESLKPLYVGKAKNIFNRVNSYFGKFPLGPKTIKMVSQIKKIDYIETESELEALLLEADFIKKIKPKYNVRFKDDKAYKYIRVTIQEDFPRVETVRAIKKDRAKYFGPFPDSNTVRQVLKSLRKIFPYCNEKVKRGKPCFYVHLNVCSGPCAGLISQENYRKIIHHLVMFLSGKKSQIIANLTSEMKKSALKQNYEKAVQIRDQLKMIEYVTQSYLSTQDYIENPNLLADRRHSEIVSLIEVLRNNKILPKSYKLKNKFRIESYDVSNIGGKLATGSMVVFIDGDILTSDYRRFRIRLKEAPDDVGMLTEILKRRFKKPRPTAKDTSFQSLPDLLLIDGGKGQLGGALKVLEAKKQNICCLALAKRQEEIIFFDPIKQVYKSLILNKSFPALKLLQRIRDEAHRFSLVYHRTLRSKDLK